MAGRKPTCSRFASAALLSMLIASGADADNWGRYDWSGFDNNLDQRLKQHLQKYQSQPLDELFKKLQTEYNLPFDPKLMKLDLSKEQIDWAKELIKDLKNSGQIPEQRVDKLTEQINDIEKLWKQKSKIDGQLDTPPRSKSPPVKTDPLEPPPVNANQPFDEDFARWAKEQLDWARQTEIGEQLLESPGFREALRDFQRHLLQGGGKDELRWQKWMEEVRLPKWDVTLPNKLWDRLPEWNPPRLPRMNVNLPRLPRFQGRLPRFSTPGLSAPSASGFGEAVLWIVVFAGCGFIVWQLIKRSALLKPAPAKPLGAWPVDPRDVRTAAELIAAFDYLSVVRCGSAARAWNHLAIADSIAQQNADQRQAADELARLYAQARYAPPADPLQPHAVESARRHLCSLAGAGP